MRSLLLARTLVAAAVVSGAMLIGAAVGGMASVDRELAAAAAPEPVVQVHRVAYEVYAGPRDDDCPDPAPRTGGPRSEL